MEYRRICAVIKQILQPASLMFGQLLNLLKMIYSIIGTITMKIGSHLFVIRYFPFLCSNFWRSLSYEFIKSQFWYWNLRFSYYAVHLPVSMEYLPSCTPLVCLEVECVCPPIEMRSRWLAIKFLLKSLSSPL